MRVLQRTLWVVIAMSMVGCPKPQPKVVKERPKPRPVVFVADLLTQPREVLVDALWVRRKFNKKKKKYDIDGGTTQVALQVMPNARRVTTVGVAEQFPGGAGQTWKASVWIAAQNASMVVGREVIDYAFYAKSEGFIDGPSAGALFTAGFMAAIMGDTVNPQASMTGTVNPDGTVGMVGGLEHKFRAAIKKGKKLLGYPEGNKRFKNEKGLMIDLEDLAAEHGAKAVPIRDIYQAYKLLTGKEFAFRKKVTVKEMALDPAILPTLKEMTDRWMAMHTKYVTATQGRMKATKNPFLLRFFEQRLKPALGYKKIADEALKAKMLGAGYYNMVRSATWAYTAEAFTEVVNLWRSWHKVIADQLSAQRKWWRDRWRAQSRKWRLRRERGGAVMGIDIAQKPGLVAAVYTNGSARLFDLKTGKLTRTIEASRSQLWCAEFDPKGQKLALGGNDTKLRIYNVKNGRLLKTLSGHTKLVISAAFDNRGRRIVTGSGDDVAKIWDAKTGKLLKTLAGHTGDVNGVAFGPRGRWVATGSDDRTVKLWDAKTGKLKKTFEGHRGWIWAVAFDPKGKYVISASRDDSAKVWNVATGKLVHTILVGDDVIDLDVGPKGKYLVLGSDDKTVRLYELKTGRLIRTMRGHTQRVQGVRIANKGKLIVSGAKDGVVKYWELESGTLKVDIPGKTAQEYKCDAVSWNTPVCRRYRVELDSIEKPMKFTPPKPPKDFSTKLYAVADAMKKRLKRIEDVQKKLEKQAPPKTVDEALALISAYEELIHGVAFSRIGHYRFQLLKSYKRFWRWMRRGSSWRQRRFATQIANYVEAAVRFGGIAFGKSTLAMDHVRLFTPKTATLDLSSERMRSVASQLFAAAKTNLDYLETMIPQGFRGYFIRRFLNMNSPTYVIARMGFTKSGKIVLGNIFESKIKKEKLDFGKSYAAIGASVAAYIASAKLRFKVSAGTSIRSGEVAPTLRNATVLTTALSRGRTFALEAAFRTQKTVGSVPTVARMLFQAAEQLRKASLAGQIKAVELYWRAALYCRLAQMLTSK